MRGLVRKKEHTEQQGNRGELKHIFAIWDTGKIQQIKTQQKLEWKWKS